MLDRPTPKSAETRARIVRGALLALEEHGLGDTTTRRIAARAGVRLATLHYHFDSKDALLLAVFDGLLAEMSLHLGAGAAGAEPLAARIAGILRASWTYVAQTRAKQIVQYELTLYALRTQGAAWLAAKQYEAYADLYARVLRTGITGGGQLGHDAAQTLARMMLAGMDGLILQGLAGASERQSRRGLEALIGGAQAEAARLVGREPRAENSMSDVDPRLSQPVRMPAEWEPHTRCWMAWPCRPEGWRNGLAAAREAVAAVVRAIAVHEPVSLLVRVEDRDGALALTAGAAALISAELDDSWTRDTGPTFVHDAQGGLAGVDWGFNGWGLTYAGFARDARLARTIIAEAGARRIVGPQILEGGSIHVDGEGTLLTTEQCLLDPDRNPHLDKTDIEAHLRATLGVETVIWLPRGLTNDETRGHVDNLCCFSAPGRVLLPATTDRSDPDAPILAEARRILEAAVDARGRRLAITDLPVPPRRRDATGAVMALSYVNFYLANGAVIMPGFAPQTDRDAAETLAEAFPDRTVVIVPGHGIADGGGNIHCITQQEPRAPRA